MRRRWGFGSRSFRPSLVLVLVAVLVACGGDGTETDDPEERTAAVEQLTGLFARSSDPTAILSFDAGQAGCAAEAVVGALGVDRLEELGLDLATGEPPTLAEPPLGTREARAVYGGIGECIDLTSRVAEDFVAGGLDEATARCAAEHYLDTATARDALAGSADPALPPKIDAAIAEARAACGAPGS